MPVWETWAGTNTTASTTTSITIGDPWANWTASATTGASNIRIAAPHVTPARESAQEFERIRERERQHRAEIQEEAERTRTARETAKALLRSLLSEEQRSHYDRLGSVIVVGSEGNRYRIAPTWVGNVILLDADDNRVAAYCAHPPERSALGGVGDFLPVEDCMIAQMLVLQTDEREFHRVANEHRVWRQIPREFTMMRREARGLVVRNTDINAAA